MSTPHERPPYDIKVARTRDEVEACYDIRIEVFSVEQGFPLDTEIDEYDPMSLHFLLTTPVPSPPENSLQSLLPGQSDEAKSRADTPKPIGTIRLTPSVGKVSRLAVDKAYRSYGFGRVLVEALDEHVRKLKGDELAEWGTIREAGNKKVVRLKLHSQMQVVSFYKKLGYTPEGDEFDEEGAPHLKMTRDVVLE